MPPRGESGGRRGGGDPTPERQKAFQVGKEGSGVEPRGSSPISPSPTTEGPSNSQGGSALSKKTGRRGPFGDPHFCGKSGTEPEGDGSAHQSAAGHFGSPKPWSWSEKGEGGGEERRAGGEGGRGGTREGWRELGEEDGIGGTNVGANECVIVTWNVQGMSVRENNRMRMRRVSDKIVSEGWEVACLTEIRAESEGVVWLGEDECRVV